MRKSLQRRRFVGAPFEVLESRQLLYAPQLLVDINTQDSSNPREFVEFGERMIFIADHKDYGTELFVTDGTTGGTHLLKDIAAGSSSSLPANLVVSGDYLYFAASSFGNYSSKQLWRTDGTAAGTIEVDDGPVGFGNWFTSIGEAVDVDGTLYFIGDDGGGSGLWQTRGDQDGIDQIAEFSATSLKGAQELTALDGKLFFIGDHATSGKELWTAGEAWGSATQVVELVPGTSGISTELLAHDGSLYFFATTDALGLWKSDGTAVGTTRVEALPDVAARSLTAADDAVYFVSGTAQTQYKLWRSDGTEPGTELVHEPASLTSFFISGVAGDRVYFDHWANDQRHFYTYNATDGVSDLLTLPTYRSIGAGHAFLDGEYYFVVNTSWGPNSLWKTDGSAAGTVQVLENVGDGLATALGKLFVAAGPTFNGRELWRIDSSGAAPVLVIDLPAAKTEDSAPLDFQMAGSQLYFTADGGTGRALWVSDGTVGNATQLIELSSLGKTQVVGSRLYFVASDYDGQSFLGVTDGTVAGTRRIEFEGVETLQYLDIAEFNGELLAAFNSAGIASLFRVSDDDAAHLLGEFHAQWGLSLDKVATIGDKFYFIGPGPSDVLPPGWQSSSIWMTDGTAAGTSSWFDQLPVWPGNVTNLVALGDALFFVVDAGPPALYRTDGTVAGTVQIPNVARPADFTMSGGYLYFTSRQFVAQRDLMRIDAQATTATLIKAGIGSSSISTSPPFMADLNGTLYFLSGSGWDAGLYRVNLAGTTTLVYPLWTTPVNGELIAVDGVLYFRTSSLRVVRSDGTPKGTFPLDVPYPAISFNSSLRTNLLGRDGKIYFAGNGEPSFAHSRSEVTGQHLFYSGSSFDTDGAALGAGDNAAIATDKTAYLPGTGPATFENISSYVHGITGVMVDFNFLAADLSLADFQFRVGANNDPSGWMAAPQPSQFRSEVAYPGDNGLPVRVSLAWADDAIKNTWLEVTVLANERTGLAEPNVFYFGSRVGDTGSGTATAATTTAADELLVRSNTGPNQAITSAFDFNRDGAVTAIDTLIARANVGVLRKLDLPAAVLPMMAVSAAPLALTLPRNEELNILAQPLAEAIVASRAFEQTVEPTGAKRVSHAELLACAVQSWNDWLDDGQEASELLGQHSASGKRRR